MTEQTYDLDIPEHKHPHRVENTAPRSEAIWVCTECQHIFTDAEIRDDLGNWGHKCKCHPVHKGQRCESHLEPYLFSKGYAETGAINDEIEQARDILAAYLAGLTNEEWVEFPPEEKSLWLDDAGQTLSLHGGGWHIAVVTEPEWPENPYEKAPFNPVDLAPSKRRGFNEAIKACQSLGLCKEVK
ncbi:MAG: hypothetical protein PHQ43_00030 [Dehalococcoidales bacterium]|nr:hypothetical protein [Dehalococcoidales bacterium]